MTRSTATRGARVCTWKQAERVLAGFPDGRADEGPTAVEPSLLGLRIAQSRTGLPRPGRRTDRPEQRGAAATGQGHPS